MKARCIFCGKDFSDIVTLENHLAGHTGLNTYDRNSYLKEIKQEIQKKEKADKRKEQAKLEKELFKEYKSKILELLTSQKVDEAYLAKIKNCKSIIQIKKIVTYKLKSYHDYLNKEEIDFFLF